MLMTTLSQDECLFFPNFKNLGGSTPRTNGVVDTEIKVNGVQCLSLDAAAAAAAATFTKIHCGVFLEIQVGGGHNQLIVCYI